MQEWGCRHDIPILRQTCKRILFVLLLFSYIFSIKAQTISSRYRSHLSNGGTTYFFCPKKLRHTKNIDRFTFDMTYHTSSDSLLLNFSFVSPTPVNIKSLSLRNGKEQTHEGKKLSVLYRDIRKKSYEIRATSQFSLAEIEQIFSIKDKLSFEILLSNGVCCYATYSPSKWKKERRQITQIINLINYQQ